MGGSGKLIITHSESETHTFAKSFGSSLQPQSIVCFFGDLGAGKTTFIKGLVSGAADYPSDQVSSPTFTYLNVYSGKIPIYHFDLYRLRDAEEFLSMGFDEPLFGEGICCIEWSERVAGILPDGVIRVYLTHLAPESRKIEIHYG